MLGNFCDDTTFRLKEQHRCLVGLSRYSWSRTLRKRQGREPGSTSVLMKDKTRPTVWTESHYHLCGHFPRTKGGKKLWTVHSDHGHEQFTQVVGSLVSTGLMEDKGIVLRIHGLWDECLHSQEV